ncbi:MAG: hypothetical protein HC764_26310 [Pleurocapsa sp. CRU_1_2]|nr:hypothetical protein [Pleurocapsa sp. CRU_1_2]
MSKKKRISLSTRLQPYSGTLLAEVVEWLNSKERDEKNSLIADAVIMAYLPYARASLGVDSTEIERCCWETQNLLDKHGFNLRQSLQVSQPQWHSTAMPTTVSTTSSTSQYQKRVNYLYLKLKNQRIYSLRV